MTDIFIDPGEPGRKLSPEALRLVISDMPTEDLLKYRRDQLRAPAGSPAGGEWVAEGGGPEPVEITGLGTRYRQKDGTLTRWPNLSAMREDYKLLHPGLRMLLSRTARPVETMAAFDQLDQLMLQFPLVKINGVAFGSTEDPSFLRYKHMVAYCEDTGDGSSNIILNRAYWANDRYALWNGSLYAPDPGEYHPPGTNHPAGYITHEFAHALDNALSSSYLEDAQAAERWHKWREAFMKAPPVTGYGRQDDDENFAETVTAAYAPGSRWAEGGASQNFREMLAGLGVVKP